MTQPLGDFLRAEKFSREFRDWYFLPMMGCIWSCPTEQMLAFPVATMIRFCHNHGLIQITDRPQWWTVKGGARHYVEKIVANIADKRLNTPVRWIERHAAGVQVITTAGSEPFDKLILAAHSDQSLALLSQPTLAERGVLGAIRYQSNRAVLHTDTSVLPKNKLAWAAWNYERAHLGGSAAPGVCLHYLLNLLQPLPFMQPVVVSLNPLGEIARKHIMGEFDYAHPVFDLAAIRGQKSVTLSSEQLGWANSRVASLHASAKADLRLQDYRDIGKASSGKTSADEPFDATCSIEMVEAVGRQYWPEYFQTVSRLLKPGGHACIQSIVIADELFDRYLGSTDFIQQYIFPGACLPCPREFRAPATAAGFEVVDEFSFGQDYARTLKLWRDGFLAQESRVLQLGFDKRFIPCLSG